MNFVDINTKNKLWQCINDIFGKENSTKKDFIVQYFVFHLKKNKEKILKVYDRELIPDATNAFEIKITADEILSDSDSDDNFIRIKKYWC